MKGELHLMHYLLNIYTPYLNNTNVGLIGALRNFYCLSDEISVSSYTPSATAATSPTASTIAAL